MEITINGEKVEVKDGLTVSELLVERGVKMPDMVSVEVNGNILERPTFDSTEVKGNDRVEFLYFMGGGSGAGVKSPGISTVK